MTSLHNEILNIQYRDKVSVMKEFHNFDQTQLPSNKTDLMSWLYLAYKIGHRDARHAAAELVLGVSEKEE